MYHKLYKLRTRAADQKGFTLIELLVVILIIGILAAIAIPSFLNQRTKATDTEAKTAVKSAQTAMETYFTDNQTYVGATATLLDDIEPTLSDVTSGTRLVVGTLTASSYELTVKSNRDAGGVTFKITRASTGATTRDCAVASGADRGGCRTTNTW